MQGLRPAEDRRERLNRHAHDVVVWLLAREHRARCLRVEAHRRGAVVLCAELLARDPRPHAPRAAKLCHLFEEVVVRVKEERDARREGVDVEPRRDRGGEVSARVREGEGDHRDRRRSSHTDVIAGV